MFVQLLLSDLPPAVAVWTKNALDSHDAAAIRGGFLAARAVAGAQPWAPQPSTLELLAANRLAWIAQGACLEEIVRILFMVRAERRSSHPEVTVQQWFTVGRPEEKRAVLRSLPLLCRPKAHLGIALRAMRARDPSGLEAIACENPYPAAFFSDCEMDELMDRVEKTGLDPSRVIDAASRLRSKLLDGVPSPVSASS